MSLTHAPGIKVHEGKKMKIFVISLKNSERRGLISKQLHDKNIEFVFFDAIDGRKEYHPFVDKYNNKKRVNIKGYPLTPGEIGCFASHFLLWKECEKLNEPIVILEDDIEIKDNFRSVIKKLAPVCNDFGLIRLLSTLSPQFIQKTYSAGNVKINSYLKPTLGTQGYIISPNAAVRLAYYAASYHEPVDDYIDNEWRHKAGIYAVNESCISHLDIDSVIGNRGKPKVGYIQRLKRECYRSYERLALFLYVRYIK